MKVNFSTVILIVLIAVGGTYAAIVQFGVLEDTEVETEIAEPASVEEPEEVEPEVTEEGGGVTVKTPSRVTGLNDVVLSVDKDDNWSMDIYGFVDEVDLGGFTTDPEEDTCEEDCDDYCDEDANSCQDICGNVFTNLCANAFTALTVCESSCAAVPPPFNLLCSDGCEAAYNDACSEETFEQCKDDCQGIHFELCTDTCYDEC